MQSEKSHSAPIRLRGFHDVRRPFVCKHCGARTTRDMVIVGPQGTLLYAGGIDRIPSAKVVDIKLAVNYVRQGLTEALTGKAVSAPVTKPGDLLNLGV